MSYIKTIAYEHAKGRLRTLYDRIKGPDDNVDNIMMVHSLRPHTMEGHMAIYKYVLHHSGNSLPKWFLETIGVWVSLINTCDYCVEHHFSGLTRLLKDDARGQAIRAGMTVALTDKKFADIPFSAMEIAALEYARTLTLSPSAIDDGVINGLRELGYSDGEILEINQVTAYFNYANRTVLGLGVSMKGDILGLSPGNSANPDDWSHQ